MRRFTSQDLRRDTMRVQEAALIEPVTLSYQGRDLVMLPLAEFERLKRRDKLAIAVEDLPEAFLKALAEPYHDAEQAALDALLDRE